jgi:hypothetical protein
VPSQGEVFYHANFQFSDGQFGQKLIVVLNSPEKREPCIFAKSTSQKRRYGGVQAGCDPKKQVFYILADGKEDLLRDTYIQLDELYEISVEEMTASALKKEFYSVCKLSELTVRQLNNCLKKCKFDISERHYKMIFK